VLFLDEPTIGLDVISKHAVRAALADLNRERGVTIVLTTHDLADVERLCPRLVIVDHGRVIHDGPVSELVGRGDRVLVVDLADAQSPLELHSARWVRSDGPRQWLAFAAAATSAAEVIAEVTTVADVRDLRIEEPEIEEIVRQIYIGER
jgi:ABC-2 type transport system ATP-binding protein